MKNRCPYCGQDELKPYKDFYCCYGCGKTVSKEQAMKTDQIMFRTTTGFKVRVTDYCSRKGTNVSALIHALLFDYLNENDNKEVEK